MRRVFWIIFFALDALLILLFAAGYLAYFIQINEVWWIELIAVFLPYLSILIMAATLVVLIGRRWQALAVHSVLVVLIIVRMNPFQDVFGSRGAAEPGDDDLTVMTFNVPRWWGYHMPEKTAQMAEFMRAVDPDLVALQEAPIAFYPDEPQLRAAPYVAVLYDSLDYRTIGPDVSGATYTPQPILSRLELIEQEQERLRRDPADSLDTAITRTRMRWQGREFIAYNLHLRTFGEKKPWQEEDLPMVRRHRLIPYLRQYRNAYGVRAWEMGEIRKMIEGEDLPVIVFGDLNSTPHNWVYGQMAEILRDVFRVAGDGWGMTYHTRLPFARIDHIFVSDEWEIVDADVVDAYLSDHLPVVAKLRWKKGGGRSEERGERRE